MKRTRLIDRFSGVLSRSKKVNPRHPNKLSPEAAARLKESWEERHRGAGSAGKTAVLEEGMEITEVGMTPEDAQFLETRKFQVTEVARWFGLPPHKLGDLERAAPAAAHRSMKQEAF